MFTVDYWNLARSRLADDGVFCQWAQLYEMSSKNIKTLLHTFSQVFPYTYVFSAEDLSSDVIMVAANHPRSSSTSIGCARILACRCWRRS